jgi:hypothetical protein
MELIWEDIFVLTMGKESLEAYYSRSISDTRQSAQIQETKAPEFPSGALEFIFPDF